MITCEICGKELRDKRGLGVHMTVKHRVTPPESTFAAETIPPVNETAPSSEILGVATPTLPPRFQEELHQAIQAEVGAIEARVTAQVEARLTATLNQTIERLGVQVNEVIANNAAQLAAQADALLKERLGNINPQQGGGWAAALPTIIAQAMNPGSSLENTLKNIAMLQQVANVMNQPLVMGMKMMSDMMIMSIRAGASPEATAAAAKATAEELGKLGAPPGQGAQASTP